MQKNFCLQTKFDVVMRLWDHVVVMLLICHSLHRTRFYLVESPAGVVHFPSMQAVYILVQAEILSLCPYSMPDTGFQSNFQYHL